MDRRTLLRGGLRVLLGLTAAPLVGCGNDGGMGSALTAPASEPTTATTSGPTSVATSELTTTTTSDPASATTSGPTSVVTSELTTTTTAGPTSTTTSGPTSTTTTTSDPTTTTTTVSRAASPPPDWIFAGDIPVEDQAVLREEMEYSRAYFSDRFGVEATDFTVLVGSGYEALSPVYHDLVGRDLSASYPRFGITPYAWVTASGTGGAVATLIYGRTRESLQLLEHYIVHEYFHVLQGQLASGFTTLQDGGVAYFGGASTGPRWLMEGLASYADYEYTPSRPGRRPFLDDRYYPYVDIANYQREWGEISLEEMTAEANYRELGCSFGEFYVYAMGFAASVYLLERAEEDSYVNYWTLLGTRPTWQHAFEEAFGIGVDESYRAFKEWLPTKLPPPPVALKLQVRWPDMDRQPQRDSFLYAVNERITTVEGDPWEIPPHSASTGWYGDRDLPTLVTEYPESVVGTGYVSLWWYHRDDLCTEYLLGWYRDGELTDRRGDATAIEFPGSASTVDWTLPGNPDTLPRLQERTTQWC